MGDQRAGAIPALQAKENFRGNAMNSMISCSRLLAVALCGLVLAGCNAVEDVPDEPSAALPAPTVVLGGHIKDLGTLRPLILQMNGKDVCLVPVDPTVPTGMRKVTECKYYGVQDQEYSEFNFGAYSVGTTYTISVKKQPFGKNCTIQNPSGTLKLGGEEIHVTCVDDAAVPHYTVTVNTAAVASKAGLKVILTTENGTCPVDVNGRSQIVFSTTECASSETGGYHKNATYVFNSQLNLPVVTWRVTATLPGATVVDAPKNCFVTGGPVTNTGGNVGDDGTADPANKPAGNVAVTVQSCGFALRVQADYSRPPGVSADPAIASGDGITLALRSQPLGIDVAAARITSFATTYTPFMVPDANGNPTTTPYEAQSDPSAFYEVVVKSSPAGMACVPGYSGSSNSARATADRIGSATDAGAVLLRTPSSASVANVWLLDRVIRCRLVAANPSLQRGIYWQYTTTTVTTTVGAGAPAITATTVRNRNLLAFFEDSTYLFGNHTSGATNNGVEQGYYNYNTTTNQITFDAMTDTNGANGINSSGAQRIITAVVKTAGPPKTIAARVSTATTTGLVIAAGNLSVAVNNGLPFDVAASTYTTVAALVTAINAQASGFTIAAASGNEIRITAPAGGVVIGGTKAAGLGFGTVAAGATATSTGVANALVTTVKTDVDWKLLEVGPDPLVTSTNPVDGSWVVWDWQRKPAPVEDRRRIFVYQHGLYTAFHVGVNGIGNLQEACYVGTFGLSGSWTRQGARSGCNMRTYTDIVKNDGTAPTSGFSLLSSGSADIPNYTNILPDYPGRWPQSQNPDFTDGRPYSLVDYEVRPANSTPSDTVCPTVDKLTVWDTQSGVRKDTLNPPIPRLVLCRVTAN